MIKMKELKEIIGKKIINAKIPTYSSVDDVPFLILYFEDGTIYTIEATYGGYTGESYDEYPSFIEIFKGKPKRYK